MQEGLKSFHRKKIVQFNQDICSEIGQDKILTFKTSSEWAYINFCPICLDYLSSEQPKKASFSGDSCI